MIPYYKNHLKCSQIAADVLKGSTGGRGKLRYLGGWVVAKLKHKKKKVCKTEFIQTKYESI